MVTGYRRIHFGFAKQKKEESGKGGMAQTLGRESETGLSVKFVYCCNRHTALTRTYIAYIHTI